MDRREEPRVVYGAWVQVVTVEQDVAQFYRAINLSRGGILLRAPTSGWAAVVNSVEVCHDAVMPEIGQMVEIRLLIENERRVVNVRGEVVYHAGDRFGVRFMGMSSTDRTFVALLVDDLPEEETEWSLPSGAYSNKPR